MSYSVLFNIERKFPILSQFINISLLEITMLVVFLIFLSLFYWLFVYEAPRIVPRFLQNFGESIYEFVITTVRQHAGRNSQKYFPFFFVLFLFILFSNLSGLIPGVLTVTSHIFQTFEMSLSIMIALTFIGIAIHKHNFLKIFLPSGAPVFLAPLLVVIEIISYVSRAFSLAIRLFANMMSGHTLLHILMSFCAKFFSFVYPIKKLCLNPLIFNTIGSFFNHIKILIFFFAGVITLIVIGGIFCLEAGIAILQAYVFIVLVGIYLGDAFKGGH
jgi:F-type H+-transporting ATPase subunit a